MILQELITKLGFETDEKPLHKLEHTLESMHHKLEFLAAVEIVKGIWELAEKFAGMGESLETAAVSAGITATEFQKLAFAASQNAVGQEELSGALARMTRLLQKAKDGSQGAVDTFGKLGITPDQIATFKNSEDALFAVQDAVKGIDDPIKRVAATTAIFGRGAAHMVKFIGKGADETKRLGKEAVTMGAVLSDQGVEDLANFEDAFSGLMQVVKTFGARIGATFAPVFTAVIHDVEHLWGANQKLISTNLKKWAGDAAYAFGFVTEIIRVCATAMFRFISAHPELVQNIAKVVASLLGLSLGVSALKLLLGGAVDSFKAVSGAASIARPLLGAAFSLGKVGAKLLLGVLGSLMERFGLLIVDYFPKLGQAIFALGSRLTLLAANPVVLTIAGIVAAVVALGLAFQAIWAMLHGKSFWDTWLGEGLNAIIKYGQKAYGMVRGIFGHGDKGANKQLGQGPDADLPEFMRRAEASAQGTEESPGLFQKLLGGLSLGGIPTLGTGAFQALGATGVALPAQAAPLAAGAVAAPANNVTINAPITINAPGGDAKAIAREAHKAVTTVLDQTFRATQRDTQAPARH